jgi:hypothetical protein
VNFDATLSNLQRGCGYYCLGLSIGFNSLSPHFFINFDLRYIRHNSKIQQFRFNIIILRKYLFCNKNFIYFLEFCVEKTLQHPKLQKILSLADKLVLELRRTTIFW